MGERSQGTEDGVAFEDIVKELVSWPTTSGLTSSDDLYQRLLDASRDRAESVADDYALDVGALLRQALLREELRRDTRIAARLPRRLLGGQALPGLDRLPQTQDTASVTPRPWVPEWLGGLDPSLAAVAEQRRRRLEPVESDPIVTDVMGESHYLTLSQRQAVRAALAAPPESTIVVCLPTGWGKTTVAMACALAPTTVGATTTLVVVPTTALALDQERRARAALERRGIRDTPARLAYHSGLSIGEREQIRDDIRSGRQRVVFTSPESAIRGLAQALFSAASSGLLRDFVVDEAHMVAEWGGGFRPEFQALAGLRNGLQEAAARDGQRGFRTLLLSATFTQDSLDLLLKLFGTSGLPLVVGSNVIRPELEYWVHHFDSNAERQERLLEAIHYLPRPAIIYTTLVEQAMALHTALRRSGFRRTALFHGGTDSRARSEVLAGWTPFGTSGRRSKYDVIVATSAFGLGVDYGSVRSVVHACVPESIDRFYQEVGRSGRDGRASVSLLMYTDNDIADGEGIAREVEKTIGQAKAWGRWQAMQTWKGSTQVEGTHVKVDLRARRPDIPMPSDMNESHNRVVLSIMAQASMIRLETTPPDLPTENGDAPFEANPPWQQQGIRILSGNLADPEEWRHRFICARERAITAKHRAWTAMRQLLEGLSDYGYAFGAMYELDDLPNSRRILPNPSCGGCPACRRAGRAPYLGVDPGCDGPEKGLEALSPALQSLLEAEDHLALLVTPQDARADRETIRRLLITALRHGIRSIVGERDHRSTIEEIARVSGVEYCFYTDLSELRDSMRAPLRPQMPELVIGLGTVSSTGVLPEWLFRRWPQGRLLVLSQTGRDPNKTNVSAADLRRPSLDVATFLASF